MSSRAVSFVLTVLILVASASASMPAQQGSAAPASPAGAVDVITVHGTSLEGNLAGDSPDRTVPVYLAASYATDRDRRYPVLYLLHGFTDSDERWFGRVQHFVNVPRQADAAIASGTREMIIVMPNAYTKFAGSMYSSSVVIGDWERSSPAISSATSTAATGRWPMSRAAGLPAIRWAASA
jgi:hypothetical protein